MDRLSRPQLQRNPTSESFIEERARQSTRDGTQHARRPSSPEGPPFACPYSKHDAERYSHKNVEEQDYRNCSTGYWTSIPRLKQHLYRTHDRSLRCCPRCWQNFPNDESLQKHVKGANCQARPMPEEKMDAEKHQKVKERLQGKPIESWYTVYHTLFPEDDLPPTPFAEWVTGNDLRACFEMIAQTLPRVLFQAAVAQEPAASNLQLTRNTKFPTTPHVIQQALQLCQREFGAAMGMKHIFATEPPQLAGSSRGGSSAPSRASVSPRQTRHSRSVSGVDEDDDPSSGITYHESASRARPAAAYQQYAPTAAGQPFTSGGYTPGATSPTDVDMMQALNIQEELYRTYRSSDDDWPQY